VIALAFIAGPGHYRARALREAKHITGNSPSEPTAKEQLSNKPLVFMHDDCAVMTICFRKIRHTLFARINGCMPNMLILICPIADLHATMNTSDAMQGCIWLSVKTDNYI